MKAAGKIRAGCDCAKCRHRWTDTYFLSEKCFNCGLSGTVERPKGDSAALNPAVCPRCGCKTMRKATR